MLSWTRVWSPTFLTETRLAFSRLVTERYQANADKDLFKEFGIGGLNPTDGVRQQWRPALHSSRKGIRHSAAPNWLPTKEYNNVWDFIQNVSINKGKHAVKFGYEYRPIKFPFFQVPSARGAFPVPAESNSHSGAAGPNRRRLWRLSCSAILGTPD